MLGPVGIAPTVTDPRYEPFVIEYDPDEDRTQIQLGEPRGSLVCVVAGAGGDRTVHTTPTDSCVPAGFHTASSASFTVSAEPTVGEPVTFSSTATDPDSPERRYYDWDYDDHSVFETSEKTATTIFGTPGEKTISHRVTDDCGATDTATRTITVADSKLTAQVAKPLADDGQPSDSFSISVSVDGETALVGARFEDPDGKTDAGAAYVFST